MNNDRADDRSDDRPDTPRTPIRPPLKPPRLELKTDPLGFLVSAGDQHYWLSLDPIAAQALAFALLSQPGVGCKPKPELEEMFAEEAAAFEQRDAAFLSDLGVQS